MIGSQGGCEDYCASQLVSFENCTEQDRLIDSSSNNLELFQLLGDLVPVLHDVRRAKPRALSTICCPAGLLQGFLFGSRRDSDHIVLFHVLSKSSPDSLLSNFFFVVSLRFWQACSQDCTENARAIRDCSNLDKLVVKQCKGAHVPVVSRAHCNISGSMKLEPLQLCWVLCQCC